MIRMAEHEGTRILSESESEMAAGLSSEGRGA